MKTASWVLLWMVPAPKKTMARLAPNAAAFETPRVAGEARGLRREVCMTAPATARPAPATMPAMTRGRRMFQMTMLLVPSVSR